LGLTHRITPPAPRGIARAREEIMPATAEGPVRTEQHKVDGPRLLAKVKEIIHEGNVRRIRIKNDQGHTLLEIPLTLGVVGAVLVPVFVAVGAIAALAADYTLEVEKVDTSAPGA
jgi:hypothetical protein